MFCDNNVLGSTVEQVRLAEVGYLSTLHVADQLGLLSLSVEC